MQTLGRGDGRAGERWCWRSRGAAAPFKLVGIHFVAKTVLSSMTRRL